MPDKSAPKVSTPKSDTFYNHLKNEKSPYLLQHVNNPVDWYPWGDKAFEKAKKENKPIFLSIGYSTCHWCHVMARESFEDPEIAELLNQFFVSVKVDREERPDIDSVYMTVSQMITGSGGWPLTIVMTPDLKPFFAGTYFPKETGVRGVGLKDIILNIRDLWKNKKGDILKSSEDITSSLQQISQKTSKEELGEQVLGKTYQILIDSFDQKYGGFGTYQKFPTTQHLFFLLRYWKRTGEKEALEMVEKTLESMRRGGVYDHIGFGFHRYSVEPRWIVPHFEKMLYDQALLIIAYTESFQITGKLKYRETAEELVEYLLRDMKSPEGGFFSAEDADSEGEEGKFYLWTMKEIMELLGPEDGELFCHVYSVYEDGNYNDESTGKKTDKNILHREKSWTELSSDLKIKKEQLWWRMENARDKLFKTREERVRPHKDDKILTDWNGLVIVALAIAGKVFNRKNYIRAAQEALNFIISNLFIGKGLFHRWRDGEAAVEGNLDDYAYLIWGLLELYQATFYSEYLKLAMDLKQTLMKHFWDNEGGGFFFTSDKASEILVRQKDAYDTALPSGNSVMMLNLEKMHLLTGDIKLRETAISLEKYFSSRIISSPSAFTMFLCGTILKMGPSFQIVIVGDKKHPDTTNMLNALKKEFLPNSSIILKDSEDIFLNNLIESLKHKNIVNNQVTAYVCGNGTCHAPVNNVEDLFKFLNKF
ncbi:MAG: thioredoxin domain-containing protein [Methanobacteriaceae archaeon]|nr:thioredoxin domain-containing protein [Methanobacteriaceae archaeon]